MSSDNMSRVKASSIYPDKLMAEISRSMLGKTLMLSLALHLVLIGVTSIRYIGLCMEYDTLYPKQKIQEAKDEADKKEMEEARQAKRAEEMARAQQQPQPAATRTAAVIDSPAATEGNADEREKTPIEKEIEEVSLERPTEPSVNFESVDEL